MSSIDWQPSHKYDDCLNGYIDDSLAYVITRDRTGFRLVDYRAADQKGLVEIGTYTDAMAARAAAVTHAGAPEPLPPGSTLHHVDALRALADDLRCIPTHDWSDEAAACEAAADHIDDLAASLCTAEDDIARLNAEVERCKYTLRAVSDWASWGFNMAAMGEQLATPLELRDAHPSMLFTPQPQNREETPAP